VVFGANVDNANQLRHQIKSRPVLKELQSKVPKRG